MGQQPFPTFLAVQLRPSSKSRFELKRKFLVESGLDLQKLRPSLIQEELEQGMGAELKTGQGWRPC